MSKYNLFDVNKREEISGLNKKADPILHMSNPLKISSFVQHLGNRLLQRLLTQGSSYAPITLDDETKDNINQARHGGQPLDSDFNEQVSNAAGTDFSSVRVHTSSESDALNRQFNAKAFTTGNDIFFREGEYQPHTNEGQELIAHELTHVVQQASGAVGRSSGKMTVNPPGDRFEQEADAVAKEVVHSINNPQVQRQVPEEEEELQTKTIQRKPVPEEEELQMKAVQRQNIPEEEDEEILQRQELDEDEEELNV